jgi:hypothetical protein
MIASVNKSVEANNASAIAPATTMREHVFAVPSGAVAFFVAMLLAFGVIWLGMYEIVVIRQSGL